MARLTVYKGERKAGHYDIKAGTIRVGRHPDSEVFLPDMAVSRLQLSLERTKVGWVATAGTGKVSVMLGEEVLEEPHLLNEDSRLQFGEYTIRFSESRDTTEAEELGSTAEFAAADAVLAAIGPVPQPMGDEGSQSTLGITAELLEVMKAKAEGLAKPHLIFQMHGAECMLNLDHRVVFIGKGDCELKIPGGLFVGARHARVTQVPNGFAIIPCVKLGKVLVNGVKVSGHRILRHQDVIGIGRAKIIFRTSLYAGV